MRVWGVAVLADAECVGGCVWWTGRLAMISMAGIWVGELLTGGENPLHTFAPYAPKLTFLP